jgi:hypothetical protein
MGLPPELDRLGAALTYAAARKQARTERRRRLAGCIAAGLLVFAAMTPTPIERAEDQPLLGLAIGSSAQAAGLCDQPRGLRFDLEDTCGSDPAPQAAR